MPDTEQGLHGRPLITGAADEALRSPAFPGTCQSQGTPYSAFAEQLPHIAMEDTCVRRFPLGTGTSARGLADRGRPRLRLGYGLWLAATRPRRRREFRRRRVCPDASAGDVGGGSGGTAADAEREEKSLRHADARGPYGLRGDACHAVANPRRTAMVHRSLPVQDAR